jgi:hypothetical protein
MKKRFLSLLLTAALMLTLCVGASAGLYPSVSSTGIMAGESVSVALSMDTAMTGVTALDYRVYYDADIFTLTGGARGAASSLTVLSGEKHDLQGNAYCSVSVVDPESAGVTVSAGTLYTLQFTASADITADVTASFRVVRHSYMNTGFVPDYTDDVTGGTLSVTVSPAPLAQITSASLTLGGSIAVNYYVLPNSALLSDQGAYARFTLKGAESDPIPLAGWERTARAAGN